MMSIDGLGSCRATLADRKTTADIAKVRSCFRVMLKREGEAEK